MGVIIFEVPLIEGASFLKNIILWTRSSAWIERLRPNSGLLLKRRPETSKKDDNSRGKDAAVGRRFEVIPSFKKGRSNNPKKTDTGYGEETPLGSAVFNYLVHLISEGKTSSIFVIS